jgi:hypothetical protein
VSSDLIRGWIPVRSDPVGTEKAQDFAIRLGRARTAYID